ncbi:MAG TPA: hypothetical protein VJZ06_02735 [Mobilitalea sp.]|nr:hypothetical protein [Mobilitalea sp.]
MGELIKIHEVSLKYDISARALKYYEDMGLIQSTKNKHYAKQTILILQTTISSLRGKPFHQLFKLFG